jgi:hypothetical protein
MGLECPRRGRIINNELEIMVKETVTVSFQIIFCSLLGATDKNYEKFQKE